MKKALPAILVLISVFISTGTVSAVPIGGIEFPDGAVSFADSVFSYTPGGDVQPNYNDPNAALGIPDYTGNNFTAASLGDGGTLILEFTDNSLTASGDASPDLHIFEVGGAVEWFNVSISQDASTWIDLGDLRGQPTSIDIDAVMGVVLGERYSYVRLVDDPSFNQTGRPYGEADIDAVGAISSAPPVGVPEPATLLLFGTSMLGLVSIRKRQRK